MGTALLSIGVRAMAASYAQMQTTGHNIANASVEGYSRQQVNLATARGQFTGVGFFGRGVDVVGVQRMQDAFLTNEAATAKSLASDGRRAQRPAAAAAGRCSGRRAGHRRGHHAPVRGLFGPGQPAGRRRQRAAWCWRVRRTWRCASTTAGEQMATLQTTVNQELQASVTAVNTWPPASPRSTTTSPPRAAAGQMPNDLLDQRDRLISQLSEHVSVSTIEADDGTLGVFMGGGQRLVLGVQAERLEVTPDTFRRFAQVGDHQRRRGAALADGRQRWAVAASRAC
jgi:flagellar hook-associated protein 1 FlgK